VFLLSVVFLIVAEVAGIRMFQFDNQADGFFMQVTYASKIFTGNFDSNPLFFIHVARLLIVLPFYLAYIFKFPAIFDAAVYLFYLAPLLIRRNRTGINIQLIFIFFPLFFSIRTSIGMCSMGYLYLILFKGVKSYRLLFVSALLANLSSGIVLSWIGAVFFSLRHIVRQYIWLTPSIFILAVGFSMSVLHKIEFMLNSAGAEQNGGAVERSTIYVSFIHEQYARLTIYVFLALYLFFILNTKLVGKYSNRLFLFFVAAVPGVFLEGIGLISYLMCFIIFSNELFVINCCKDKL